MMPQQMPSAKAAVMDTITILVEPDLALLAQELDAEFAVPRTFAQHAIRATL